MSGKREQGNYNAVVKATRDYHLAREHESLETRLLRAVVNNIRDALIYISPAGKVVLYNAAAISLLNTNRNITGDKADDLLTLYTDTDKAVKLSDIIKITKRATERSDLRMRDADGSYINLRLNIIPIKSEYDRSHQTDGTIIMAADITDEKSLDDERDEFISVVSHELRTPVAITEGALSNLQLLMDHGDDPRAFADTLNAAHKQILYLGQMVNDLSTLSRAQRGVYMDSERIDIASFMASLESKYRDEARERHLNLIVDIGITGKVIVPSMVIEEIMQNFITNALKYTPKGKIVIGAKPTPGKSGYARFYVTDSGIGMSLEDQKHIFERFWRSEDYRTRRTSGTGLGLHVVDQLARKINAKVNVESKLNEGSTFSIDLPVDNKDIKK